MRYLKMALISFVVFFSMFTIIGLLFPSTSKSVNAVVVNKKKEIVLKELQVTPAWIQWYPFFRPGIGEHIDNAEKDSTVLFNDKREILLYNKKADSNSVSFFTRYDNGIVIEHTVMVLDISGDSSQVQVVWHQNEKLKWYPWERFRGLVLENVKKQQLDTVLNRFKQYLDTLSPD